MLQAETSIKGRNIWVTRPLDQSKALCKLIESAGGHAVQFPAIEIVPVENKPVYDAYIEKAQIIIFVSKNAVQYLGHADATIFGKLINKTIIAVGERTRRELMANGVENVIIPESGASSESLLRLKQLQPAEIAGKTIVIVRGEGGRETLAETLRRNSLEVKYLEMYRRKKPDIDQKSLKQLWQDTPPDAIVVTSAEGLENLMEMTNIAGIEDLINIPLVVLSSRIQSVAMEKGFACAPQVAPDTSDNGLMKALIKIFRGIDK